MSKQNKKAKRASERDRKIAQEAARVSFDEILSDFAGPQDLAEVQSAKSRRRAETAFAAGGGDRFVPGRTNEVVSVDNQTFKLKKNKAKTTVVSNFKINLDPSKTRQIDLLTPTDPESEPAPDRFEPAGEDAAAPQFIDTEPIVLDEQEVKNDSINLIVQPDPIDRGSLQLDLPPKYYDEIQQQKDLVSSNNQILEKISTQIDSLISTTEQIKDDMDEQQEQEREQTPIVAQEQEQPRLDEVVPPTFINVPIVPTTPFAFQQPIKNTTARKVAKKTRR